MKRISKIILFSAVAVLGIGFLFPNGSASALPVVGFQAGRIIDDAVFTAKDSMNPGQIQNFLNSKVPNCDTNGTQPSEYGGGTRAQWGQANYGQSTFTCLRNYSEGGKSAAQIIYDKAQAYSINPQVLIVLLQKEQGLVTDTWPLNVQYRTATGYGCPDTAPCDSQYYGLSNQLDWAAKMFRAIMNASPTWYTPYVVGNNFIRWSPASSCGGSNVNIQNRATQALYNYTPYQPNQSALNAGYGMGDSCGAYGNRNFYLYFNDWFGPSVTGQHMSPLFKGTSSDTIYAIFGDIKYPVASFGVLNAYGLLRYPVVTVSDALLSTYTTGQTISSTVAKKQDDPNGAIYLFDDGKRYPMNIEACEKMPDGTPITNTTWKIDCFNSGTTHSLPNALIDNFTSQDMSIPNVIAFGGSAWKLENGKKRRIIDPIFVDVLGGWGKVRPMKDINALQPEGKLLIPDESLVKFDNSPVLYYLVNALLYPIPSPDELSGWRIASKPVYNLPASHNSYDPLTTSSDPLRSFAKDSSNNSFVIFPNGTKASLSGQSWPTHQESHLPDYVLEKIPTIVFPQIFRSNSGSIYTVNGDKKSVFPTPEDITFSGFQVKGIQQVSNSVDSIFTYDGLRLSPGRLFKVSGDNSIYYVYSNTQSLRVDSTNKPGLPYDKLINVDVTTGAHYTVIGTIN
ncbi:hypothetical protein KBD20_02065 [Candidatus Saccharibacteria bacterium]|nr:hypothetical protein [Candidatus Saccharibacteria bacterium]